MSSPVAPTRHLADLASRSSAAWLEIGARIYAGELSVATGNSVYRFREGIFISRAQKPSRSFEAPKEMRGLRIIGFLREEGDTWLLTPQWRVGSHAVLWRVGGSDPTSFLLTSPTTDFALDEPEPKPAPQPRPGPEPSPWMTLIAKAVAKSPAKSPISGVMLRRVARPPTFRRPLPPSMTRIHNACPAMPDPR